MPKMDGALERRDGFYWDTLIQGTPGAYTIANGAAALGNRHQLFARAAAGNLVLTNLETPNQLPSDQTYRIASFGVWLMFRACTGVATYPVGGVTTDHMLYHRGESQISWEFFVGPKTYFQFLTPHAPYGGGLHGDVGNDTTVYFTNGIASDESTHLLGRSLRLPPRQNFRMDVSINPLGAANLVGDINALTAGEVDIKCCMRGLHVREVL